MQSAAIISYQYIHYIALHCIEHTHTHSTLHYTCIMLHTLHYIILHTYIHTYMHLPEASEATAMHSSQTRKSIKNRKTSRWNLYYWHHHLKDHWETKVIKAF